MRKLGLFVRHLTTWLVENQVIALRLNLGTAIVRWFSRQSLGGMPSPSRKRTRQRSSHLRSRADKPPLPSRAPDRSGSIEQAARAASGTLWKL